MAKLMYFAQLADTLGKTSEQVTLSASTGSVKALIDWMGRRDEAYKKALAEGKELTVMVNRMPATLETAIADSDEVAFIPERQK
ncbi:MAG: MoaD/ThiS family protein [Betaproteobacteria bacterium]|nr:MoaD/ThiS family protein [Betaproteobacteria bacterium]